MKLGINTLIDI